ncbi:hypothetical protein QUF61_17205 [Candidatus Venteria ishoeyi]|uniref:hypothetical protein n=1 Tax=Candidatus Venteria ishoeyi TaxID=1899563 RepID=UPI0025A513B6|nr:hypothetical protein [Candidatus Venteria ishoeyi]MDM8548231.1 hypothetical protein [Candidatus Venteria ishoeyi]
MSAALNLDATLRSENMGIQLPALLNNHAKQDFLEGQMAGYLLNAHLKKLIFTQQKLDIAQLLPDLKNQSLYYQCGLKDFIFSQTFPLILELFYQSRRSRCERIRFMDNILAYLRDAQSCLTNTNKCSN